MRCQIGDLAIVVSADNRCNLGSIVRIVALHDGKGDLNFSREAGPVWMVTSARPLTWVCRGKRLRRKTGPVPDRQLKPIRSQPSDARVEADVKRLISTLQETLEQQITEGATT